MAYPVLGDNVPRRGNCFSRWLGRTLLSLAGWRLDGDPPDAPKFVVLAAPHTSNWDFVIGMAALFALGLRLSWLGKQTLFRRPFGPVMRWLGGLPIDRRSSHGIVAETVRAFEARERFIVAVAPEGTRSKVDRWKTGFYHIACQTGVPIAMGFLDYRRRVVGFGPILVPGGDLERDLAAIRKFYATITPRRPAGF